MQIQQYAWSCEMGRWYSAGKGWSLSVRPHESGAQGSISKISSHRRSRDAAPIFTHIIDLIFKLVLTSRKEKDRRRLVSPCSKRPIKPPVE